jgi:Xaa-Pro aminopeptidase
MWHCWLVSYRGYWVENIRTAVVGGDASRIAGPFAALKESLLAGQDAARPGATAADVHRAIMGVLRGRPDDGGLVLNRAGHGMGLEYHEPPFNEDGDETELQSGTVLTIEPGIWFPGTGGLAVSNTVVVRDGDAEVLTSSPIDLEQTAADAIVRRAPVGAEA